MGGLVGTWWLSGRSWLWVQTDGMDLLQMEEWGQSLGPREEELWWGLSNSKCSQKPCSSSCSDCAQIDIMHPVQKYAFEHMYSKLSMTLSKVSPRDICFSNYNLNLNVRNCWRLLSRGFFFFTLQKSFSHDLSKKWYGFMFLCGICTQMWFLGILSPHSF